MQLFAYVYIFCRNKKKIKYHTVTDIIIILVQEGHRCYYYYRFSPT